MSISDYWEDVLLDSTAMYGSVKWVGLSTADPTDDASGLAEPSGNAYARVEIPSTYWAAASGGSKANDTAITFPRATGSWGTITHVALFDSLTGGNMLASGALSESLAVTSGIAPQFAIGNLVATLG